MLRNTVQHYLYWKQEIRNEIEKTVKLLRLIVWCCVPFVIVEALRQYFFNNIEFLLNYMFLAIVALLIIYWMPNKKEFREWKKTHSSTF